MRRGRRGGCHRSAAVIAAGYIGFSTGRLSILERQADGRFAVAAGEEILGDGKPCELQIVRFEPTGLPAILVAVSTGMRGDHSEGWIFRWNGTASRGVERHLALVDSGLHEPELVDVRHDGTHEIVAVVIDYEDPWEEPLEGLRTYTFRDRELIEAWWACFGNCQTDAARLTQPDGRSRFALRLINGERGGAKRVRVSSVTVNGRERLPRPARGSVAEFIDVPLGPGLKPGDAVRVRATPTGSDGRLVAVLIRQP